MNTRRTKRREVNKIVEVDSGMEGENPWIRKISPELWDKIFNSLKNSYTEEKPTNENKALAQLRLVDSHWKDLVDGLIEFSPELTHRFLNGNYSMKNVRMNVERVVVSRLSNPIKSSQIPAFFNPNLVSEIIFGELVSKENFLVLAEHFGKTGSVKCVKIFNGFLVCDKPKTTEEKQEEILGMFWREVEKLELIVPNENLTVKTWKVDRNMIPILNKANLPKLKDFKITAYWTLMNTNLLFTFLLRHRSTVKYVDVQLTPFNEAVAPALFLPEEKIDSEVYQNPAEILISDLESIQLERITICGGQLSEIVWKGWIWIIMAQRELVELKLSNVSNAKPLKQGLKMPLPFVHFIPMLQCNKTTLTSLELLMFHFCNIVDFKVFKELDQLKNLKLQKHENGFVSRIVNVTSLPGSLETLSIIGLLCLSEELKQLAETDHLNKLSHVEYHGKNLKKRLVLHF